MQKLLVIGGSGLVGSTFIQYAKSFYDIIWTYNKNYFEIPNTKSFQIDLVKNEGYIENLIKKHKPDVVLHTVAHSSVDLCELDHKSAYDLHVIATEQIANACKTTNSKLLFLSTDAVFDGKKNKKYTEFDSPNPVNYYGKTKLEAEKIVMNSSKSNVVLRTSVIYGWHKKSKFTNWILDYLKNGKSVDPFSDQFNTPTLVDDISQVILKIIQNNVSGLFHATGKTCLNRYEFAINLAKTFSYDASLVHSVTKNEKKQEAPRPTNTCLDSTKLENILDFSFSDIYFGLKFIFDKSKTT